MASIRVEKTTSPKGKMEFFRGFLKNPKEVGSVIPSSKFLTRRVLECGDVANSRVIVELGPGTGVLTRPTLEHMPKDGKLIAIEINRRFVEMLRNTYPDPRLHVSESSATEIEEALSAAGESEADLVVSGIPFSTLEKGVGRQTLEAARRVLSPTGRFVAYQFRSAVARVAEPVFGRPETHSGFWNLPPMKIYVWKRDDLDR